MTPLWLVAAALQAGAGAAIDSRTEATWWRLPGRWFLLGSVPVAWAMLLSCWLGPGFSMAGLIGILAVVALGGLYRQRDLRERVRRSRGLWPMSLLDGVGLSASICGVVFTAVLIHEYPPLQNFDAVAYFARTRLITVHRELEIGNAAGLVLEDRHVSMYPPGPSFLLSYHSVFGLRNPYLYNLILLVILLIEILGHALESARSPWPLLLTGLAASSPMVVLLAQSGMVHFDMAVYFTCGAIASLDRTASLRASALLGYVAWIRPEASFFIAYPLLVATSRASGRQRWAVLALAVLFPLLWHAERMMRGPVESRHQALAFLVSFAIVASLCLASRTLLRLIGRLSPVALAILLAAGVLFPSVVVAFARSPEIAGNVFSVLWANQAKPKVWGGLSWAPLLLFAGMALRGRYDRWTLLMPASYLVGTIAMMQCLYGIFLPGYIDVFAPTFPFNNTLRVLLPLHLLLVAMVPVGRVGDSGTMADAARHGAHRSRGTVDSSRGRVELP